MLQDLRCMSTSCFMARHVIHRLRVAAAALTDSSQHHYTTLGTPTKSSGLLVCRPDWDATVGWLKGMGADVVTTEERLRKNMGA